MAAEKLLQQKIRVYYLRQKCIVIKNHIGTLNVRGQTLHIGTNGMPDLTIIQPQGKVMFIEVKSNLGVLSEVQIIRHLALMDLGHNVYITTPKLWFNNKQLTKIFDEKLITMYEAFHKRYPTRRKYPYVPKKHTILIDEWRKKKGL